MILPVCAIIVVAATVLFYILSPAGPPDTDPRPVPPPMPPRRPDLRVADGADEPPAKCPLCDKEIEYAGTHPLNTTHTNDGLTHTACLEEAKRLYRLERMTVGDDAKAAWLRHGSDDGCS